MAPVADKTAAGRSKGFADAFAAALLDPGRAVPAMVAAKGGGPAVLRYAVYRNNVAASLVNALADIFPAVARLVGEDFFAATALAYARAHPPRSRLLFEYGRDFPDFLRGFGPAGDLPYLADVAAIERAWLDAFHAADAEPLSPAALAAVAPQDLPATVLAPHPAFAVLRSPYAAFSIVEANRGDRMVAGPVRGDVAQDTMVTRPRMAVEMRLLPPGAAAFLLAMSAGRNLGEALQAGFDDDAAFDPAGAIGLMLEAGAFGGLAGSGLDAIRAT
jgi:hypothetical protein